MLLVLINRQLLLGKIVDVYDIAEISPLRCSYTVMQKFHAAARYGGLLLSWLSKDVFLAQMKMHSGGQWPPSL